MSGRMLAAISCTRPLLLNSRMDSTSGKSLISGPRTFSLSTVSTSSSLVGTVSSVSTSRSIAVECNGSFCSTSSLETCEAEAVVLDCDVETSSTFNLLAEGLAIMQGSKRQVHLRKPCYGIANFFIEVIGCNFTTGAKLLQHLILSLSTTADYQVYSNCCIKAASASSICSCTN